MNSVREEIERAANRILRHVDSRIDGGIDISFVAPEAVPCEEVSPGRFAYRRPEGEKMKLVFEVEITDSVRMGPEIHEALRVEFYGEGSFE